MQEEEEKCYHGTFGGGVDVGWREMQSMQPTIHSRHSLSHANPFTGSGAGTEWAGKGGGEGLAPIAYGSSSSSLSSSKRVDSAVVDRGEEDPMNFLVDEW